MLPLLLLLSLLVWLRRRHAQLRWAAGSRGHVVAAWLLLPNLGRSADLPLLAPLAAAVLMATILPAKPGRRGLAGLVKLATASEALLVAEQLQGTEVCVRA